MLSLLALVFVARAQGELHPLFYSEILKEYSHDHTLLPCIRYHLVSTQSKQLRSESHKIHWVRYTNNTVNLNWTTSSFDSDTYFFRALLSDQDQSVLSGNHSIADSSEFASPIRRMNADLDGGVS